MSRRVLLTADAVINLVLGVLLIAFPARLVRWLGIPAAEPAFYPGLLGGVLVGIGIALLIDVGRGGGLGLGGAVAINLSAGVVLGGWLLLGDLELALRGALLLWSVVAMLLGISLLELLAGRRH